MRTFAILLLLALNGCATTVATIPSQLPPTAPPVEVQISVPPDPAFDRVMAALVAEGFTIDQGDRSAGLIKTTGVPGAVVVTSNMGALVTGSPTYFFRATIMPREGGSTIALNVTGRVSSTINGRQEISEEFPLYQCQPGDSSAHRSCRESYDKIQARLSSVAARLRQ